MRVFSSTSADGAWRKATTALLCVDESVETESRGGRTRELLHCALELKDPRQRWVISRIPALNVAFALAEVVWILAGRNDVAFLRHWNRQYPKFVGTSGDAHGAYGKRLRGQFGVDQLDRARRVLDRNPSSRQVVLSIWSPTTDLPFATGRPRAGDIPCNVLSCLRMINGRLEWMQICRSNDIFLGFPHNAVQFTYLQEVLAGWMGVDVGRYVHVVNSLHAYGHDLAKLNVANKAPKPPRGMDIRLSWRESQTGWNALAKAASDLVRGVNQRKPRTTRSPSLPPPLEAIYWVLAAEDARRHGWAEEAAVHAAQCEDRLLAFLWNRWFARVGRQRPGREGGQQAQSTWRSDATTRNSLEADQIPADTRNRVSTDVQGS
ncbi:MAG: Thymidylate synthase [Phycisphaerales bacterium]|nr:Thymidylate synthase [Phycisphaerales bacterium]